MADLFYYTKCTPLSANTAFEMKQIHWGIFAETSANNVTCEAKNITSWLHWTHDACRLFAEQMLLLCTFSSGVVLMWCGDPLSKHKNTLILGFFGVVLYINKKYTGNYFLHLFQHHLGVADFRLWCRSEIGKQSQKETWPSYLASYIYLCSA